MRDLAPQDSNWMDDAIEWIGEAIEHIGSGANLEHKVCIIDIKDYKGMLPPDMYYINQVSINDSVDGIKTSDQLEALLLLINLLLTTTNQARNDIASTVVSLVDGTIQSSITQAGLEEVSNLLKVTNPTLNQINARIQVLENDYAVRQEQRLISYCTNHFSKGMHCEDCDTSASELERCYMVENDRIKASFESGKLCLSYTAFATDEDCYPLVPDDISFKEAMFWYIFKKMLLRGMESPNGFDYMTANQQWQYYCTQARNESKYPDIDRYESFMNQWVRLIPQINKHETGFQDLNTREDIYRGMYNTYGTR